MIVFGADMHNQTHTVAAVAAATGELAGERTVRVSDDGFLALLEWARALGEDRVWALEDCRHVSGSLERFLMASGERVVRVATKLMSDVRRAGRERGKSDRIDALAVARAALREGLDALPSAQLAGVELDLRLLVDRRERLIRSRVALNNDLLWHLHDLWPELKLPGSALFSKKWSSRIGRRRRAQQTARVRIARHELRRRRDLTVAANELETEISDLVDQAAPHLLSEPGFGPLTTAKLLAEIAGTGRFVSEAKLARAAGVAPIPVTSGKTNRAPARPRRQPPAQHRDPPHRAHPGPLPPRDPGLPRAQTRRRQDRPRSHALPQTPPHPPHLAPAPAAPPSQRNTAITINLLT